MVGSDFIVRLLSINIFFLVFLLESEGLLPVHSACTLFELEGPAMEILLILVKVGKLLF